MAKKRRTNRIKSLVERVAFINSARRGVTMKGIWYWPGDQKEQGKVVQKILGSEPLLAAFTALSKSKDGLSNSQLDAAISSFSQWNTRWVIDQLLSLGFIEYKVEWFGDPGRYMLTELGKDVFRRLTGQPPPPPPPPPQQPPAAAPAVPQAIAAKPTAAQ